MAPATNAACTSPGGGGRDERQPPVRPRNWYRIYNLAHRIRWGHWPAWGASYGMCGSYLTECEHCGKWC